MASYYLTEENTTNIHDNTNLHTLILMNNPNLATQFDQQLSNSLLHQQFTRPGGNNNITLYGYPQEDAREVSRARQGLSLSLSSDNQGVTTLRDGGHVSVLGSKYLRVAQELLEQIVNVGHVSTITTTATTDGHSIEKGKSVDNTTFQESEKHGVSGTQLSTIERQETQMKKAKLVTMLDEAEQRYRQYNNQMKMVIESFERAAGIGSAKTYTALALKTISKQFRCLKDAIQSQIRAANKSLGEDHEGGPGSSVGKIQGSRLKFIDHQIRQQRALQQLGMIPNHNAWRPQRGLPERSVSVLRAWLFEHFLHPYPKDSDKILLAKQTGLTRSQVSNWFINARVRLWKPMIEDMYNEELKDRELNISEDKSNNNEDTNGVSNSVTEQENINISETQVKPIKVDHHQHNQSFMSVPQHGFTLNGSLEMAVISQGSPKRQRSNEMLNNEEILIKFGDEKQDHRNNVVYPNISGEMNFIGGELGTYPNMGDLGRFETDEFSTPRFLSLGLPFSENQQQQFNDLSDTNHATFMSPTQNMHHFRHGNDFSSMNSPPSQSPSAAFECIDIHNRKGFSAQLQPDFVA